MGIKYLVDTNIVSELMRPIPNATVSTIWEASIYEIASSAISWHELLTGTYRLPPSKRRTAYERFLHQLQNKVEILPYEQVAAKWFAIERARLTGIGRMPSYPDGQIAAVAATNNLILVTRNVADFSDFNGLTIENWFEQS